MMREERHGDVTRLVFESVASRSMGFDVSAYSVRGVLIDTGFRDVQSDLRAWLDARHPEGIILSHHHEDHAGNIELVAREGYPIWLAPETLDHVRAPAPILWYRRWCWGVQPPLRSHATPLIHPDLEVIHTPGHSSDHHVVWDRGHETVFGGDLFLGVKVRVSHPWPREDVRAQISALRKVIALRPKRYFDAHRGPVPNAIAQLTAKADWLEETVGAIDGFIALGWSDARITRRLLGGETWTSYLTAFDYSRRNLVQSARATTPRR